MATENLISILLPSDLYERLQQLAAKNETDPAGLIARFVERDDIPIQNEHEDDPVLALIGAYASDLPLIDGIPASEDPDLYLLAQTMGYQPNTLHAWEIAPNRYQRGPDGRAIRRTENQP